MNRSFTIKSCILPTTRIGWILEEGETDLDRDAHAPEVYESRESLLAALDERLRE